MSSEPKNDEPIKVDTPKTAYYKYGVGLTVLMIIAVIAAFQWYQYTVSYETLQGYWNIAGNIFILISHKHIQYIEFATDGTHRVLLDDPAANIDYVSILPVLKHEYRLTKSIDKTFDLVGTPTNPFNNKTIEFILYPVIGVIQVINDGKEVARLTKDNQMSVEYLSTI